MVKVFVRDDKRDDLLNFLFNTLVLILVLGLSAGIGLMINNGYDKNSYDDGFYDGLSAFCGDLSVGLKDGNYVCYDETISHDILDREFTEYTEYNPIMYEVRSE